MHVSLEQTVPGVEPDEALDWWTDFEAGGGDHAFVPGAQRRVHDAGAEGILIQDEVRWLGLRVFSEQVTAKPRGNKVELVGKNTFATFRARYVFEHTFEPDGTLVRLTAQIQLKSLLSFVEPLAEPIVRAILRWDTRKHLDQLRADVASRKE